MTNVPLPGAAPALFARYACPDCGARPEGKRLLHADTCPIAQGIDSVTDGDRAWFEANPDVVQRQRPLSWAEAQELRVLDQAPDHLEPVGPVVVTSVSVGRVRSFQSVRWLPKNSSAFTRFN